MEAVPSFVIDFAIVIAAAILGTFIAMKFRQPAVIAFLALGAIAGPNMLGILRSSDIIEAFAQLGAIFLLFVIGLEFNITKLLGAGAKALVLASVKMTVLFLVAFEVALWLGFDETTAIILGMIFSITSTAIMIKILRQKWLMAQDYVSLLISELVIEDLIAVIFLTIISNMQKGANTSIANIAATTVFAFAGLFAAYYIGQKVLMAAYEKRYFESSAELYVFGALGIVLAFTLFAGYLGVSTSIGAFVAGSLVGQMPFARKVEEAMDPFQLSFSAIFFISIGTLINPAKAGEFAKEGGLLVGLFMLFCFGTVALLVYLLSNRKLDAVQCGIVMLPLGEFSMIIAKEASSMTGADLVSIAAIGVLATAIVSSLLLDGREYIRRIARVIVPEAAKNRLGTIAQYVSRVVGEFEYGGYFFTTVKSEIEVTSKTAPYAIASAVICVAAYLLMQQTALDIGADARFAVSLVFVIFMVLTGLFVAKIAWGFKGIIDTLANIFAVGDATQPTGILKSAVYNLFFGIGLVMAGFASPLVLGILRVPQALHLLGFSAVIIGILLIYKSVKLVGRFTYSGTTIVPTMAKKKEIEDIVKSILPPRARKKDEKVGLEKVNQ
ncbi:MAG: cation:proton antiporter [Candidatus Micrarchaeia archaeon]